MHPENIERLLMPNTYVKQLAQEFVTPGSYRDRIISKAYNV